MELVFFLEEQSTRAMLEGILPRLFTPVPTIRYVVFEGKQDLDKNIMRRLRGYLNPTANFIVVRDQDSAPDCRTVKRRVVDLCAQAGRPNTLVRVMCRELETIYLADLKAVGSGLEMPAVSKRQAERKFRNPDLLGSPSREMATLTAGAYQKISASRAISPYLDLDNTRSPSFSALINGIRRTVDRPP